MDEDNKIYLTLTAQIVAAHLSHNNMMTDGIPNFINSVMTTLKTNGVPPAVVEQPVAATPPTPAVPIKKSVFADHIICLEDGKKLKMLKRHLQTSYDMTPEQYRQRWGLPPDYPMVAPEYAARRSTLAKTIGLGKKSAVAASPKPRGRPSKASKEAAAVAAAA